MTKNKIKAYVCFQSGRCPQEGCAMVFAQNANLARAMVSEDFGGYIYTSAWRLKEYDQYATRPDVFFENGELPKGAPAFFTAYE